MLKEKNRTVASASETKLADLSSLALRDKFPLLLDVMDTFKQHLSSKAASHTHPALFLAHPEVV